MPALRRKLWRTVTPSKLQRLQNEVLRVIRNLPRFTSIWDLYRSFKIPYLYNFITHLCRERATAIRNHENVNIRTIGRGEARGRKYKRLKLGGCQVSCLDSGYNLDHV